jgi:putative transposase
MQEIMRDVCADFGRELAELHGEPRHVHLLVNVPPTAAISRQANSLNGVSSRRLLHESPGLRPHHWRAQRPWSGSYFAGSAVGALSRSCAGASSSRTGPPDRPPSPPD